MKLTKKEIARLQDAKEMALKSAQDLQSVIDLAVKNTDIDKHHLWEMKNYAAQIEAVIYNVHHDVYEPSRIDIGVVRP